MTDNATASNGSTCVKDASTRSFVPKTGYFWYPMYVKYRQELKVQKALTDQDIISFIPMTEVLGRRNGVDQRNVVPAIHNLIFIYSSQERITWMKMHNEVCTRMQYMSFRNNSDNTSTIITVPENQMQNIIKAATVKDPAGLRTYEDAPKQSPFAKPDREIEFVGGPFEGVKGVIKRVDNNRVMIINLPQSKCIKIRITRAQDINYL